MDLHIDNSFDWNRIWRIIYHWNSGQKFAPTTRIHDKYFNADLPGSISEFQAVMKEFLLKYKLYRILIRGKGLEFVSYRSYSQDDDASTIDWKASMRSGSLLVKQYRDERNLKIMFIIDVGDNMILGSQKKLKCEYAAEVVAAFSHLIMSTGDRAGYILFSSEVKEYVKPSAGKKHFARFMNDISNPDNYGSASDINKALEFALSYIPRSIQSVILVSDFININKETEKKLASISSRFDALALVVKDPLDITMPSNFSGEIVIEDPSTGQQVLINPSLIKEYYSKYSAEQEKYLRKICLENKIDNLELNTTEPFVPFLAEFLKGRIKKKI